MKVYGTVPKFEIKLKQSEALTEYKWPELKAFFSLSSFYFLEHIINLGLIELGKLIWVYFHLPLEN